MLGLFKPKPPIDEDEFEWLLACYAWFVREFGGIEQLRASQLVLPNARFFPASRLDGHDRAEELFGLVKHYANMGDWPCDLVGTVDPSQQRISMGPTIEQIADTDPLGTFSYQDGQCRITYRSDELSRPQSLVAVLAHELAHYLMHSTESAPPGGRELEEHATDLAAVFLGFGVFLANSARSFEQFQSVSIQGWQSRNQGYLSEQALVTGLAIFVRLTDASDREAMAELKPYLHKPFRMAIKVLDRRYPMLSDAISNIDLSEWA